MTGFTVLSPGILSLLQDSGRYGYSNIGLTTGGPLDAWSFNWANRLLQNAADATAIEISIGGLQLQAGIDTFFCVCGAEIPLQVNGEPKALWTVHKIHRGDKIALGMAGKGLRAYLAVAGGFQVTPQFGSTATVLREGVGGLNGQKLQAADIIAANPGKASAGLSLPAEFQPRFSQIVPLRLVEGYQINAFSLAERQRFYRSEYQITPQADRMGYKLSGTAIECQQRTLLSEGICYGAVQIPPDGQPIVLLNDRQTLGGYPKMGTVLSQDLWQLAQAGPGARVYFRPISAQEAHYAMKLARIRFNAIAQQLVNV
ncbi:biotin-dependent carboxyltransferase family protein [Chromatiaceae bacterium AAb-1]|nr:biotin-dependent carboxyltransferase family protein [Chromatiaceae bacterium AAb-1]